MNSDTDRVIKKAQVYAKLNYRKGMDVFADDYSREEWIGFVTKFNGEIMEWQEVKRLMRAFADASLGLLKK